MNNLQSNQDGRKPIVADATPCEIEAITIEESRRLVELETTIGAGLQTFVEVGEALLEIRDARLYRIEHRTFEAYCREKWGMSRPRVYQLIGASQVTKQVSTIVDKAPSTESQARPLTKLPPEQQAQAWSKAVEMAGGEQPTAKQVEVAVLELVDESVILQKAREIRSATAEVKRAERVERLVQISQGNTPLGSDRTFNVIYADPPWRYGDRRQSDIIGATGAEHHYPTMTLEELRNLEVESLASENCVLFLWATSPLLKEALELCEAWGFKYKAQFVWDKIKHNMGHYNSVRHELLLICTRGSATPENVKLFDSVQSIERTEHSRKPEEFRDIINTLYPSGNRIELFARRPAKGWHVWGNQIPQEAVK
jgi:N6-adenosine-specific RNA methylase IME4